MAVICPAIIAQARKNRLQFRCALFAETLLTITDHVIVVGTVSTATISESGRKRGCLGKYRGSLKLTIGEAYQTE